MSVDNLTPQQERFLKYYVDPKSDTWANAKLSALKAGYEESYAINLTSLMPKWLSEALEDSTIVQKALNNLSVFIDDSDNKAIQWDATKFALSRLAKGRFSERVENTGKDGKDIPTPIINVSRDNSIQEDKQPEA